MRIVSIIKTYFLAILITFTASLSFLSSTSSATSQSIAASCGIASWYGGGEKLNKHTANGEVFNPEHLTCASWNYPFDTFLRVTNIANGKSVIVKVNDRGPAKRLGRAIDLSRASFRKIADIRQGVIPVRIEKINQK